MATMTTAHAQSNNKTIIMYYGSACNIRLHARASGRVDKIEHEAECSIFSNEAGSKCNVTRRAIH